MTSALGRPTLPPTVDGVSSAVDELFELRSSPFNWLHNPCGVTREHFDSSTDDDTVQVDYVPFLIQLMVTLERIQRWINDFVRLCQADTH